MRLKMGGKRELYNNAVTMLKAEALLLPSSDFLRVCVDIKTSSSFV